MSKLFRTTLTVWLAVFLTLSLLSCTKKEATNSKKVLNLVFRVNVGGLDPAGVSDRISATVIAQIFDSLYQYNYKKLPYTLEPSLASGLPEISKDRKTYRIRLKSNVFFHDDPAFLNGKGRELKASDVVYSWKRLADPRNRSEAYFVIENKIVGLTEWARGVKAGKTDYDSAVPGLRAVDDRTLEIKLEKPCPYFTQIIAMPTLSVVAREVIEKYSLEVLNHPIGTGPFLLARPEDWVRNSKMTLVKNPNYREEIVDGKKLPLVDSIVFNELIEDQPRWQNGITGKLDIFDIPNDNFAAAVKDQRSLSPEMQAKKLGLDIAPELGLTYLAFNMRDPVVGKNKKLRQAISLAFDSKVYIEKFLNGRGIPAQSMVPPGIDTYSESYLNPYRTYDLAKAKRLLEEAGFKDGEGAPELVFDTLGDTKSRQIAEFVSYSLQPLGLRTKISTNTFPELLKKMGSGRLQMFNLGWGAVYPDPQAFFMAFYGPNRSPGPNGTSYENKEYDSMYELAIAMEPSRARDALYRNMRDILVEDCVWIFNAHRLGYSLRQGWVRNYKPHELALNIYKYVELDLEEKARLAL